MRVTIDWEPGEGLPGSVGRRDDVPDEPVVLDVVVPYYTSEAITRVLEGLGSKGYFFDGPLTITTEKVRQYGGDDGFSPILKFPGVDG